MGEMLLALVEPARPDVTPEALISWCRERLTHYKCPRSVELVADLPRTAMGKLSKRELRARYGVLPSPVAGRESR
jgi:long-chain acyl-CoA synthetase